MYPNPDEPQQLPRPQLPNPQPLPNNEYGGSAFAQQPRPQDPAVPPQPQYLAPVPEQAYGLPYRSTQEANAWQQPTPIGPTYEQGVPPSPDNPQLPNPQLPQRSIDTTDFSVQTPNDEHSRKGLLIGVAIVAAVLIIAAIIAAIITLNGIDNKKDNDATNKAAQDSTSQSKEAGLATLRDVTLIPPSDLSRYTPNDQNTQYTMAYTTTDGSCSLNLGVADAETLPGKDLAGIVSRQMQAARDQGLTLTGPTAGTPLELINAGDSSKKYSMPTLVFTTTNKDGTHIRSHYSAAVLADGKRAYITRICQSTTGEVTDDTLRPIDEDANNIVVRS